MRNAIFLILYCLIVNKVVGQAGLDTIHFTVSIQEPGSKSCEVHMQWPMMNEDTLDLLLPRWTPGYYQFMDYASNIKGLTAVNEHGQELEIQKSGASMWRIVGVNGHRIRVMYTLKTSRRFVANSFVDDRHAYIVGANTFFYSPSRLHAPVKVRVEAPGHWDITTGLSSEGLNSTQFIATDYDELYDSPILCGELEELPSFAVRGVEHRFVGYRIGAFDREAFMEKLEKVVGAACELMGDIPFERYTFLAIGPGRGGIEHLDNTTISFDGRDLDNPESVNRTLKFLTHEYFHHYNVKRIRPFELGPFDYQHGNKTNQLWISEGLTVYYEYVLMKRAGLVDEQEVLADLANQINTLQSNKGRHQQTLQQASYYTWTDGPFGQPGKTVSVYNKGTVVGFMLDLAIRGATDNAKSLDDVMRACYQQYYLKARRGFTEAEFQNLCEQVAGQSLRHVFEYVYTTREIDYASFLKYAGMELVEDESKKGTSYSLKKSATPTAAQAALYASWMEANVPRR